jgi:hydroxypyruvate reductase
VVTLLMSDVPGDDPIDIASGPTVPDPTTCADALAVVRRYGVALPTHARALLDSGQGESVKPGDARLARCEARRRRRWRPRRGWPRQPACPCMHILGDSLEGEARDLDKALAAIALQVVRRGQPFTRPCVLPSGGETTVTVRGRGRGGRNVAFLLSLAIALGGCAGVYALAADTDGVDGAEEVAGAFAAPDTLARALALGIRPVDRLADNDGHGFFGALGDARVTGPTRTNVNDFRAILVL